MTFPAMLDGVSADLQCAGPLGYRQAFASPFNPMRQTSIAVLLMVISPSAILRRIAERIVNAVNRMTERRRTHIRVETLELSPAVGHGQPLGSVVLERMATRVVTTLKNMRPDAIFTAFVSAVFSGGFSGRFTRQTTARLLTSMEMMSANTRRVSAGALTFPVDFWAFVVRPFNHGQTSINSASSVHNGSAHVGHLIIRQRGLTWL